MGCFQIYFPTDRCLGDGEAPGMVPTELPSRSSALYPVTQDACTSCAGLGRATRYRSADHLDLTSAYLTSAYRRELCISTLPEDAMEEIREGITTNTRFNPVVDTGVPGLIPSTK
jgi:hypothetical protein